MHLDLHSGGRIRDSFQGALELLKASSGLLVLFVLLPQAARGTAYYVSCTGNDNNIGTSTSTPWATLVKASSHTYAAGDELLLQDGCVWTTGTLQPTGSGASGNPILLANYGTGALPRIIADNAAAVYLLNLSYWTVQNLDLSQVNQTPQALDSGNQHGKDADLHADTYMWAVLEIRAENSSSTCTTTCTSNNITIENLVVHDGQWIGIFAEAGFYNSGDTGTGYINNLTIQNVEVRGNQAAGIAVEGTFLGQNAFRCSNVQVLNSWVYDNGGDGIVILQVNGGVSQGNHTAYNGLVRNARVGNWTWNSQNVNIQFNESDHNKTPLSDLNDTHARDGGGYDLDLGSINSTVQYNWSHDNYGEGVLLLAWPVGFSYHCCTTINATVRYNVFERDAQKQAGGITIFGGVNPGWIYGNTVYNVAARPDSTGAFNGTGGVLTSSIYAKSGSPRLYIYNNNFITDGTVNPSADDTMVWGDGKGTFTFNNNSWHRVEGGDDWYWSGDITSFSAWQGKGFDSADMDVSPSIIGTLGAGPVAYQLGSASPLI